MKKSQKILLCTLFWVYCALMLYLLFFQRMGMPYPGTYGAVVRRNCNLIPLKTIRDYLLIIRNLHNNPFFGPYAVKNLVGNVVMFVPLGFFLPCLWKRLRVFWRYIMLQTGLLCLVEVTQLFTLLGSCDVDDLILNTVGSLIGYVLFFTARAIYKRRKIGIDKSE